MHIKLIKTIEIVVLVGALLAMGIPRGWGKTFVSVRAVVWAVAYRHHTMCMLIAASDDAAKELIDDIVDELQNNQLLQEDFPELCLPIAALEDIRQRAKGQTSGGQPTNVKRADHELRLGDVNGVPGAIIYAGGIEGSRIRGKRKKRGDRIERPTLGLVDDFQTRRSAASKRMIEKRIRVVQADVPGLPGKGEPWSCLLTCTVIEPGDAADQLLDRSQHPDWRGVRQSFLESLPTDDAFELWEEWNRIREDDLRTFDQQTDDEDDAEMKQERVSQRAHDYYRAHHKAMNDGAVVAWEWAYSPDDYVDALENAMHWYYRDRLGFWSELQNDPGKFEESALPQLRAPVLAKRTHRLKQHIAPQAAEYLTAHADVAKAVLWYELRAWAQDSTSWTIDYGTWPAQKRPYFTQATAKKTIDKHYANLPTWEIRCMAAIRDLFDALFARQVQREDGSILRLNIAGIDANDETETVKEAIRKAGLQGKLWPMHSRSFRGKTPINDLAKKDGDYIGDHWRRRNPVTGNMRYITYDSDYWKSHHRDRLVMPPEIPGALTWYGGKEHRMLADHHCAEWSENVHYEKQACTIEQWTNRPGEDNHLWDVGVGNDVLGAVLGLRLPTGQLLDVDEPKPKPKRRKTRVSI